MLKKSLFFAVFLSLVIFLSGCLPVQPNNSSQPSDTTTNQCYGLEPSVSFAFNSKTYIRIRANVSIIKAKFGEFQEIGALADNRKIYFLGQNHQGGGLADFLFILLGENPEDKNAHIWDVYVDQAKQNNLPEFVTNCQETGDLIPIVGNSAIPQFPPRFFKYEEIQNNQLVCALANSVCAPYYLKIQKVEGLPAGNEQVGTLTKSYQNETHSYNVFHHNGVLYLEDQASKDICFYNPSESSPVSENAQQGKSLQIGTFKFINTTQWTWATPSCKPVIYLYPEKPTALTIKINPYGQLTKTEPFYDPETGWEVLAHPDGKIESVVAQFAGSQTGNGSDSVKPDQGRPLQSYPYLYYEGIIEKFRTPDKGWVVKKEKLSGFFEKILPQFGLNKKEARDFQEYWLGRLTESPYYLIAPLPQEEIKRIEPVEFSVKPDTFIRVRFYFKDLDSPILISSPILSLPFERKGLTVVEWGGLYKENF